jgi:DNA (cytosine-5)-methyltransferase 1
VTQLRALDLFAGAGGLGCGFEWHGGVVVGAVEVDPYAAATLRENHKNTRVWEEDIRRIDPAKMHDELGDVDVIIGGPMCQGVSQRGPRNPEDQRNFAFRAFASMVKEFQPRYFLMENVPALVSDVHNRQLAISVFSELESLGYHIAADVVNAAWFGVPQLRFRCIVMGARGSRPCFPPNVARGVAGNYPASEYTTVGDALMDLPAVVAGGGRDVAEVETVGGVVSSYATIMRGGANALFNHWSADTDEINLERIRSVPEGGNWRNIPSSLIPARFASVRSCDHTTTYGRLHRDHPAYTITTECGNVTSGAYTHPTQDRAITVREAARLQGFPDRYRLTGPRCAQYRQVGNAVPPWMAKQLINSLVSGCDGSPFHGRLSAGVLRKFHDVRLPFVLSPRYKSPPGHHASTTTGRRSAPSQPYLPFGAVQW